MLKLQNRTRFTVQEMAEEVGVSRRTMLRDLQALSEMGVPLAAAPGPGGGYRLITRRRLLPLSLTADEAISMVLSYEAFLQYAASPFASQSLSALTKLRNALPADVNAELDRVQAYVVWPQPSRDYEAPFLSQLLDAARDGVHLDIVYESASGVSERRIFPYGLYAHAGFWYCACYDYKRNRDLTLRADRLVELTRVEGLKPVRKTTVREWLQSEPGRDEEMVTIRARLSEHGAKNIDVKALFLGMPITTSRGRRVEVQFPSAELDYLAGRILPMGLDVVIESPPELVEMIATRSAALAREYNAIPDTAGQVRAGVRREIGSAPD
jgi:predicted DNA-binding transcriptional regulator YafY